MSKVSLCILFYNNRDLVKPCLDNIFTETGLNPDYEVLALDNGSTDGTYEAIRKYPAVKALRIEQNRFFSGGANYLLEKVNSEHVFFMSSDVFPQRETIHSMVLFARDNPDVGIIGCKSILPDGMVENTCKKILDPWKFHFKYGAGTPLARFFRDSYSKWYLYENEGFPFEQVREVEVVQDSFIYIRGKLVKEGLRYDEKMKLYFTEDDICLNTRTRGYKVVYYPRAGVRHLLQKTLDQNDPDVWGRFLDDSAVFCSKYYGMHGKILNLSIGFKRKIKKVLDRNA